jgi:hypothetical protein
MFKTYLICLFILVKSQYSLAQNNCLFKNPLCFYNTNILSYLQVLHKNQQYEQMTSFFYGPLYDSLGKNIIIKKLNEAEFGYSMKYVGIKVLSKNKWSLTYQRTILGTNENFKIDCSLINDTCRIYLDKIKWKNIFK